MSEITRRLRPFRKVLLDTAPIIHSNDLRLKRVSSVPMIAIQELKALL